MKASECKCVECGKQAVAFWPVIDPDIPAHPYCRQCLDKIKMETLAMMMGLEADKRPKNPTDYECSIPASKCPHGAGDFCIGLKCKHMKKVLKSK